jgi:hypothetical protein
MLGTQLADRPALEPLEHGHKLNLPTGQSGLILDLVIEAGNPGDSERLLPVVLP